MEDTQSIGEILKLEREKRELSLSDVTDATKITANNISALEESRFDYFPNRVYARAFLRDYSNFLGVDSDQLLSKYEREWLTPVRDTVETTKGGGRSVLKTVGIALLSIVIAGGLAAAGYYGWDRHSNGKGVGRIPAVTRHTDNGNEVAQLPKPDPIKPAPAAKPGNTEAKKTEEKPVPVSDKLTLEVTTLAPVWADIKVDGQQTVYGNIPMGQKKTFEAKSKIYMRVGRASAVQLKVDGKPVVMEQSSNPVTKVFEKPVQESTVTPDNTAPADTTDPR
ncbi:MAG: RodZ domain-containing protein [Armatimonadota bacterium]|nr:DUF4115 domain-containing protein [bacterium]